MENYISEVIAGLALLFSAYTQIRQKSTERALSNLREEVLQKQSKINDLILFREKSVVINVSIRDLPRRKKALIFKNSSSVNAESFNVTFKDEFKNMYFSPPILPYTLCAGEEVVFKYAATDSDPDATEFEMSWIRPNTNELQKEKRIVNL